MMKFKQTFALISILTIATLTAVSCKNKQESSPKQDNNKQQTKKSNKEKKQKEKTGKIGPKGPPSIDNGGITKVPTDPKLVEKGKKLFKSKGCKSCHALDKKVVGPALGGVTERREPEWIARMVLHPSKMIEKDPTAKKLLSEHMTPMPNQGLKPDEAKALIAYFGSSSDAKSK
jgi:mono/diheme cytochrome c family protein